MTQEAPDLGPCPLCGEAEVLEFRPTFDCEALTVDVAGETLILEPFTVADIKRHHDAGRIIMVDHVACLVCGACMPLRTWQGWRPTPAARELYRAYYCDDDPQPWETTV